MTIKDKPSFENIGQYFSDFELQLTRYPQEPNTTYRIKDTNVVLLYIGNRKWKLLSIDGSLSAKAFIESKILVKGKKLVPHDLDSGEID